MVDLNVSTPKGQSILVQKQPGPIASCLALVSPYDDKFLPSVLLCIFYRALIWAFAEMESFARELDYLYS